MDIYIIQKVPYIHTEYYSTLLYFLQYSWYDSTVQTGVSGSWFDAMLNANKIEIEQSRWVESGLG